MVLTPDDVFIPGGLPDATYVTRESLKLSETIERWAGRRQRPLLSISGPTKSGKTVLLKKTLSDAIWFSGGAIDNDDDFWSAACDELEVFTDHALEVSEQSTKGGGASGQVSAGIASGTVSGEVSSSTSRGFSRSRSGSTKAAARKALKSAGLIIVIDDFHYVPASAQLEIVRGLKDLIFDGLGVVVAAVPHRAYDVVRVEKEMTGRVEQVEVSTWETAELQAIATQGFQALGVECERETVSRLAAESFGSPHLMQTHCLALCDENGRAGFMGTRVESPISWDAFYAARAASTSKSAFDMLKRGPRQRSDRIVRKLKSGIETDIYGAILAAIESTGPKTQLTYEEVRAALRVVMDSQPPQRHEITNVLEQMTSIAQKNIEGEPVIEYDAELSTLYIADPFFAYYLRWAPVSLKEIGVVSSDTDAANRSD